MAMLEDYEPIVGKDVIDELYFLSRKLSGKSTQHINSTAIGGGVAEILNRMVPLLNNLGIQTRWDVIKAQEAFFEVTKKFHNALHGEDVTLSKEDFEIFMETSDEHLREIGLAADIIFVHDPQPIALVRKKAEAQKKWIWRCHIDISNPNKRVWNFLEQFVLQYDASVFSAPAFSRPMKIRQFLISPSIDPLSDKNIDLPSEYIDSVLQKYGVPKDRPIITQISRFDRLKDPLGVVEAFKLVRKYIKCRLVLAGGTAADDPESQKVYSQVLEKAAKNPEIHILLIPPESHLEVNALQRASTVIVQKSIKEGFGLTISEALWKAKPVVASAVGGIPLQIKHKWSGLLCRSIEGAALMIKQLLHSPEYARKLGENGREHVRNNFLLTRHLKEYLLLFLALYNEGDIIYL